MKNKLVSKEILLHVSFHDQPNLQSPNSKIILSYKKKHYNNSIWQNLVASINTQKTLIDGKPT